YPLKWKIIDSCPLCGSKKITSIFKKFGMNYSKCRNCQFVFLNPSPTNEMFSDFYNSQYYNSVREFIEIPRALSSQTHSSVSVGFDEYRALFESVTEYVQKGYWLDIGGGIGAFLSMVANATNSFRLCLNETNSKSAEFARGHFGFEVVESDLDNNPQMKETFDVLSLISVVEHIPLPLDFLKKALRTLKNGGVLVLNTPRFSRFNRLFSKESSYNVIPPYHVSLFDENNLCLIEKLGLKLQKFWFSGQNAFSFLDLLHISEMCDVKIPEKGDEEIEVLSDIKLGLMQKTAYKMLSTIDKIMKNTIRKVDGTDMMNFVFVKK
ncbi:class I SAM-dependent methyltransferase, partial [candidate division WOR-3 bacterium]|nr:class I SAM-dependent methyltransferase [candidate division WOR-3 bacterium]